MELVQSGLGGVRRQKYKRKAPVCGCERKSAREGKIPWASTGGESVHADKQDRPASLKNRIGRNDGTDQSFGGGRRQTDYNLHLYQWPGQPRSLSKLQF